jgi:hypothetical protein
MIMRAGVRAGAPLVWVLVAAPAPVWRAAADGDGVWNESNEWAGTPRAAGRAALSAPRLAIAQAIGRSACCLTASCISTFGAPIKAPGAGGLPSAGRERRAGRACKLRCALWRSPGGALVWTTPLLEIAGPARSATGIALEKGVTPARNWLPEFLEPPDARPGGGAPELPWGTFYPAVTVFTVCRSDLASGSEGSFRAPPLCRY